MRGRRALVTGSGGQLGSYVVERLVARGVDVFHGVRRGAFETLGDGKRIPIELADPSSIANAVAKVRPDIVVHLAAPSFVGHAWAYPTATLSEIALATTALLESVRICVPEARVICAASADVFAGATSSPQSTTTPFSPRNPYGIAKAAAAEMVRAHRDRHRLRLANAFFYLLESPKRSLQFVLPKIADGVAAVKLGEAASITLGDLEAVRDFTFAGDAADAVMAMIDAGADRDALIGSGRPRSVRDVVRAAFSAAGIADGEARVKVDPTLVRPREGVVMTPDVEETERAIGWRATTSFEELVQMMVDAALKRRSRRGE